jgi:hypothetical protein
VHNLEHGGIVVWYGQLTQKLQQDLIAFYRQSPNGVLITGITATAPYVAYPPHKPLRTRVALTAWTAPAAAPNRGTAYVSICPRVVAGAFRTFRDAFRGKGPERFPVSSLRPGT